MDKAGIYTLYLYKNMDKASYLHYRTLIYKIWVNEFDLKITQLNPDSNIII